MTNENETLTLILAEARAIVEERGEAGLRVAELAERCNVAVGLLYHYFKDRQDLIAEVRARQFIEVSDNDMLRLARNIAGESTFDGLITTAVREFAVSLHDEARKSNRWKRVQILAAAAHNERLHDRIGEEHARSTGLLMSLVQAAQENGLLRDDISPSALALLIESIPLGTTLADLSPDTAPSNEEWSKLLEVLLKSLAP